jgi:iron-sulfur cluster repair protein YtfE (RIC family)
MLRPKNRQPRSQDDLVGLLLECHERIRRFVALARAAGEAASPSEEQVREACASVERYFEEALPLHVLDEEESILPRLRSHSAEVDAALSTMHAQHAEHGQPLRTMLRACATLREAPTDHARREALSAAASELERAFEAHLRLEETVLFPAIRASLSESVQADIVREVRGRRAR